ncbi:oxygen-insensitive NADPH nitroreductase [Rubeoparvulum massiliense]|uniref:oxygen-insensitive NADPH nitroreductase n=1 Tax=Rubeoparvulum massiliense TaxID=1631346 RepID=UPI00065DCC38|nr:oxygen-insensitive NADPH nitroreductase [Rubeoparvulum massiliense]
MNQVIQLLKSHRSIRKFTDETIPEAWIEDVIKAGQAASTSSFLQTYSVISITDSDRKAQLAELTSNPYVATCSHFLVFCANVERLALAGEMHQTPFQGNNLELFLMASLDTALMAQNVMVAAESLGLGGVYIGGIRNQIAQVSELLQLPQFIYPVFGMCLGYPDHEPELKPRLPLAAVYHKERYQLTPSEEQELLAQYDKVVQAYYTKRTGGKRTDTWTESVMGYVKKPSRTHLREYLEKQGFRFD